MNNNNNNFNLKSETENGIVKSWVTDKDKQNSFINRRRKKERNRNYELKNNTIENENYSKNLKLFCKLKKKYLHIKKKNKILFETKKEKKKKKNPSHKTFFDLISESIINIINCMNRQYIQIKNFCINSIPNLKIKRLLYFLIIYILINIALFIFSIFLYLFLYYYVIPQNKYIYPIDFSLVKNPIEDYLKNKKNNKIYFMNKSEFHSMNEREEFYVKHLNSIKNEILDNIKNNHICCCPKNFLENSNFPLLNKNISYLNNEKLYVFDNKIENENLQNNILTGYIDFQNNPSNDSYYNEQFFYKFFLPFFKKKKNILKIKKGYKIDIFLNFTYINNDYNDKLDSFQVVTEIFNNSNNIILRKEKLYINNENYEFIKKLHLLFNTPFYFFNVNNNKTKEILLVNNYEYVTDFSKVHIYIHPPIQIYRAYVVILIYVNFIYYYIYKYPFLFFYIFVFILSSFLIFLNTIFFFFVMLYYFFIKRLN
ncbi:conserved Plasmodium protein, unknown function [Plasmodium gallinaceum]|uniref:Seipin domain-containing protein n=1 Tax=Plasmodium gallinaceum TaxID=5849 RepID=A0A1J1GLM9_PLAGA|nr:conserved Plasmodium protein, unknown function [Plasmodium gallinaceum]CRG93281.1 conserved Plasmodium protein, unknown function [Plasmodium gallinaceum]